MSVKVGGLGVTSARTARLERWAELIRSELYWLIPVTAISVAIALWSLVQGVLITGDTGVVLRGSQTISWCLSHGIFSHCEARSLKPIDGYVGPFALYQYLATIVLQHTGSGFNGSMRGLQVLNLIGFVGSLFLSGWVASRTGLRRVTVLAVLLIATSPLLYYSGSSFGESLATFLAILFVVSALRRWHPVLILVCGLGACITKETMFPVAGLLGGVAIAYSPVATRPRRRSDWLALAGVVVFGYALGALFNVFRYGTVTNIDYENYASTVHGFSHNLQFFVDLIAAPNGGLAVFWPVATAVVIGLVIVAVRAAARERLAAVGVLCAVAFIFVTLSDWWAPFGWVAWGPRLLLPVMGAAALTAIVTFAPRFERGIQVLLGGPWRILVVVGVIGGLAMAQVNVLHAQQIDASLFTPDNVCRSMGIPADHRYYKCFFHAAWGRHWLILMSYQGFESPWGVLMAELFAACWIWFAICLMPTSLRGRLPRIRLTPTESGAN